MIPFQTSFTAFFACSVVCAMFLPQAFAGNEEDALRAARERYPAADLRAARPTPISGIYEFDMGGETVYGDGSARYLILGRMLDMNAATSSSARRANYEQAARTGFTVRSGSDGELVVFSDPHCPYCAQLERRLANGELDGYTVIVVLAPFLPGSSAAAARILCAAEPRQAYLDYILKEVELPPPCGSGGELAHFSAVRAAAVAGIPTLLAPSGAVFEGLPAVGELRRWADSEQLPAGR